MKEKIDLSSTGGSSDWWHERYCNSCKATTGHEEFMTNICLSCGYSSEWNCMSSRASRRYFNGEKTVIQHRYSGGQFGYSDMTLLTAVYMPSSQFIPLLLGLMGAGFALMFLFGM